MKWWDGEGMGTGYVGTKGMGSELAGRGGMGMGMTSIPVQVSTAIKAIMGLVALTAWGDGLD